MADLSAYVDFSIKLDKSITTPAIVLTDISTYPAGVALYIAGVFSVTQPDGISVVGNFITPDIYWSGSALVTNSKELRLATDGNFQQGIYTITYTVQCTGYSDTVKTKTFTLTYTAASLSITDLTDVFTPSLEQLDSTIYVQDGFGTPAVSWAWLAYINYAGTSVGTITGNNALLDLKYSGQYWDASYQITLTSTVTLVSSTSTWASVIDKLTTTFQIDAYTPPTIQALLLQLNTMKQQVDAGTYCGGRGCGCGCSDEQAYNNASADYQLLKSLGCNGQTVGLYYLIPQLLALFTCNSNYVQTHLFAPLAAYNFGCGSGGAVTPPAIQFTVDSGALFAPASGQAIYDNPTLAGNNNYLVYRQSVANYLVYGTDFTYRSTGGFTLTNSTPEGANFVTMERFTLVPAG